MRIEFRTDMAGLPPSAERLLRRLGTACLKAEGLPTKCQTTFIITDDVGIQGINRSQRGVDAPTDVLSFPSTDYPRGETARHHINRLRREIDDQTGCIHLGDIIISLPRAAEQAMAYGHSVLREVGFLYVHGVLHLMGYDHETEAQRTAMRAMEEAIMEKTGLSRSLTDIDMEMLDGAREAMNAAYAPYSKYKVGACIRTSDGRLFKGCNVENASYGMTICAERNAMTTAVTEGMHAVEAVAIVAEGAMPFPCGACRQFMREFGRDIRILITNDERVEITTLEALLPESFGPESLPEVEV